ncbi:AAA family ATPase [Cohnella cellulosilytica]|uniref:AAA family ATPase n=1 Tax=Cohnella cellulosilytica TaxID=986710 RepID=A0ABW2FJB9_9BACL
MYLKEVTILQDRFPARGGYPFSVPALRATERLRFDAPVTFFVGENGSGKSTLLEAIAWQCGFHTGGGGINQAYELESSEAAFGPYIRLSWLPKVRSGFFLRAESFFDFASHLDREVREQPQYREQIYASYGGKSLHEQSHGESFLSLFRSRFGKQAIYLLDEPEAALSPARQLNLLSILHGMRSSAQFVIATHSPILLGFPDARIYSFDEAPIAGIAYEDTPHYQLTRRFLENRKAVFRDLFGDD